MKSSFANKRITRRVGAILSFSILLSTPMHVIAAIPTSNIAISTAQISNNKQTSYLAKGMSSLVSLKDGIISLFSKKQVIMPVVAPVVKPVIIEALATPAIINIAKSAVALDAKTGTKNKFNDLLNSIYNIKVTKTGAIITLSCVSIAVAALFAVIAYRKNWFGSKPKAEKKPEDKVEEKKEDATVVEEPKKEEIPAVVVKAEENKQQEEIPAVVAKVEENKQPEVIPAVATKEEENKQPEVIPAVVATELKVEDSELKNLEKDAETHCAPTEINTTEVNKSQEEPIQGNGTLKKKAKGNNNKRKKELEKALNKKFEKPEEEKEVIPTGNLAEKKALIEEKQKLARMEKRVLKKEKEKLLVLN